MNRRGFLTTTGIVVLSATPARAARRARLLRGGRFAEGVMSGDPTPTGITVATRLVGAEGSGEVELEIARDPGFDRVVVRARLATSAALGYVVKARVSNLKPHTRYWYRFAGHTAESPVGRLRTALPADSRQFVQFGVVYGFEYTSGFFTPASRLADEDVDFVLNLGNYVSANEAFDSDYSVRRLPSADPATTVSAYRRRYREYRRDANLRRLHASHPLVSTWDGGEVMEGYAGAELSAARKRSAYQAWYEAMPHYPRQAGTPRVYGSQSFGRTLDLFVCDTRQYRRPAPSGLIVGLLGATQSRALRSEIKDSAASWKLIASPAPLAGTEDGWLGYQLEREELLATIDRTPVDNAVFLSGGRRRFAAADVADAHGKPIAAEFGVASITQRTDPTDEGGGHGYAVCSVADDRLTVRFEQLGSVRTLDSPTESPVVYELRSDAPLLGLG